MMDTEISQQPSCWLVFYELQRSNEKLSLSTGGVSILTGSPVVLPMSGLSEVGGIVSDTIFRKKVNERRTVTSVEKKTEKNP